jgi:2-haloacid dehalogenase
MTVPPSSAVPTTVVLDLGGVLVDWNPRRLLSRLEPDRARLDRFLTDVATPAWHDRQDRGRSTADATAELPDRHPQDAELAAAFYGRWEEMFAGELPASVDVVRELQRAGVRLLALTNWPTELFARTRDRFPVLAAFETIVVSGDAAIGAAGLAKPDPEIFRLLADRYAVDPARAIYVDDNAGHVAAAAGVGFTAYQFSDVPTLRRDLASVGLPVTVGAQVRSAVPGDLPALAAIYDHYVTSDAVTFDLEPFGVEGRRPWFDAHGGGRARLLVAVVDGEVVGYASSGRFREKGAYDASVETSVYLAPGAGGRGIGSLLYQQLFADLQDEDVHMAFAGITQPNPASEALHARFGFTEIGVMREVGRKLGAWHDVRWLQRRV